MFDFAMLICSSCLQDAGIEGSFLYIWDDRLLSCLDLSVLQVYFKQICRPFLVLEELCFF